MPFWGHWLTVQYIEIPSSYRPSPEKQYSTLGPLTQVMKYNVADPFSAIVAYYTCAECGPGADRPEPSQRWGRTDPTPQSTRSTGWYSCVPTVEQ